MATPYREEDLKRNLYGIFPRYAPSIMSTQPVSASSQDISTPDSTFTAEATIPQEPMPERIDAGEYLDAISEINARRSKMAGRANAMLGLTGRPQNFSFGAIAGEQELKQRMGLRDEEIQAEILNRQRAAILRGEINNIDEQMQWYQTNGFDPHFAKTAREAAQSIFDQRFQEAGQVRAVAGEERAVAGEERAVLGEARAVETAARAAENLKINIAQEKRAAATDTRQSTERSRNELKTTRENLLLAWAADKWWALQPSERTEAKKEEIGREMTEFARNENFQGFDVVAGKTVPITGRDQYRVAPSAIDLDEENLLKVFRDEAKVVLDEDAEDEDFVSVPARTYSDQYEEDWRTAADDFETASNLAETINAAIRADDTIAPENKQAVLERVLKNLESVEKGVGRPTVPTVPAMLKNQQTFEGMLQVAPFPAGGELSTPENIREAQNSFTRTLQMMERTGRASNEYLAQLVDPMFKDRMYREMTAMKAMHPDSRSIAMNNNSEPNLVAMRNAVGAINERLSDGKYKNDEGKTVKLTDADRMNLEDAKLIQFQKYADYWGVTPDYAEHRYDPEAYRRRNPNL